MHGALPTASIFRDERKIFSSICARLHDRLAPVADAQEKRVASSSPRAGTPPRLGGCTYSQPKASLPPGQKSLSLRLHILFLFAERLHGIGRLSTIAKRRRNAP